MITIEREMGTASWTIDGAIRLVFGSSAKVETVYQDHVSLRTIEIDGVSYDVILKANEIRFIPA